MIAVSTPSDDSLPILRLTTLRSGLPPQELDPWLRASLSAHAARPGLAWSCVARRAVGSAAEHVLASVWSSAMDREATHHVPGLDPAVDGERLRLEDVTTERLPIRISAWIPRADPMTIMRLFRGRTRTGEREAYLEEARAGSVVDGARPDGPGAVACGVVGTEGFVTVSLWLDWASVEACTGGDIHRPLVTRNAARIERGGPTHFEVIALVRGTPGPTPARPSPR